MRFSKRMSSRPWSKILVSPLREEVAVGEDETVVVGEENAGVADGVEAVDGLGFLVVDKVAVIFLAVGEDFEQDEGADDGVEDLSVIEGLVEVGDVLGVDALSGGGVVLDLDGEIAADGFDKDFVFDGDVRMLAGALHIAVGTDPVEFLLGWEFVFVVEAVAEVFELAIPLNQPFEGFDVVDFLTDPQAHVEVRAVDHEFDEGRFVCSTCKGSGSLRRIRQQRSRWYRHG